MDRCPKIEIRRLGLPTLVSGAALCWRYAASALRAWSSRSRTTPCSAGVAAAMPWNTGLGLLNTSGAPARSVTAPPASVEDQRRRRDIPFRNAAAFHPGIGFVRRQLGHAQRQAVGLFDRFARPGFGPEAGVQIGGIDRQADARQRRQPRHAQPLAIALRAVSLQRARTIARAPARQALRPSRRHFRPAPPIPPSRCGRG